MLPKKLEKWDVAAGAPPASGQAQQRGGLPPGGASGLIPQVCVLGGGGHTHAGVIHVCAFKRAHPKRVSVFVV